MERLPEEEEITEVVVRSTRKRRPKLVGRARLRSCRWGPV